jgi:hypothetical protein
MVKAEEYVGSADNVRSELAQQAIESEQKFAQAHDALMGVQTELARCRQVLKAMLGAEHQTIWHWTALIREALGTQSDRSGGSEHG